MTNHKTSLSLQYPDYILTVWPHDSAVQVYRLHSSRQQFDELQQISPRKKESESVFPLSDAILPGKGTVLTTRFTESPPTPQLQIRTFN
jgi:hypothetical protein